MIYGYARISRKEQSIERQVRNIRSAYPDAVISQEAFTGTTTDRPVWMRLKGKLVKGDIVVFDSVSRMSRNAQEGYQEYKELYDRGVDLYFLKEPHINTTTFKNTVNRGVPLTGTNVDVILEAVNQYLMILAEEQIRLAFDQAQKEVDDLHQRTREGILTAQLNGKKVGRPEGRMHTDKERKAKSKMKQRAKEFGGDLSDIDCMKVIGISKGTYYKYKKELKTE